jgi:hypothetical protein
VPRRAELSGATQQAAVIYLPGDLVVDFDITPP